MPQVPSQQHRLQSRLLGEGEGWCVREVVCAAGPDDPSFEEAHAWTTVAAVLSGTFTYRTTSGRALMTPGSFLLGDMGACFECGHTHGTGDRCVAFSFAPELIDDAVTAVQGRQAGPRFSASRLPPFDTLLPLTVRSRLLCSAPDQSFAETLALDIARSAFVCDAGLSRPAPTVREQRKAAEAIHIIEDTYSQPLMVADLARAVGLGRQRFALAFRRSVGVTPYNYVLRRRLDSVAETLRRGDDAIATLALDAGFGDISEFNRRFKARFGVAPKTYRRQCSR